ncbi:MAG: flagellar motor switch phosphatase FliY [Bacillota bacterium]
MVGAVLDSALADVIAEVGNISMGSAATALSALTSSKVRITAPSVRLDPIEVIAAEYPVPAVVTRVNYTEGLSGENLLVVSERDAKVIADLMMGGPGEARDGELGEIEISAIGEAMNQMMGAAANAMSTILNRKVAISPPDTQHARVADYLKQMAGPDDANAIKVVFNITIEGKVESHIAQIMPVEFSKELARAVMESYGTEMPAPEHAPQSESEPEPQGLAVPAVREVPIVIGVRLGRVKMKLSELESVGQGGTILLDQMEGSAVDVICGGLVVARGELVVVGDSYGVRITQILNGEGAYGNGSKRR